MRTLALALAALSLAACGGGSAPPPAAVGASSPPSAVRTPPPEYPEALACNGVGGTVQLRIRIEADGRIRQTDVQKSSGNAELDAAAQAAVRGWTFNPAKQAGKAVAQWIAVPMTFHVPQPRPERCFALDEQQAGSLQPR
ncbi:MAG TPA: energy transducer TonB [Lysobacter sp.]